MRIAVVAAAVCLSIVGLSSAGDAKASIRRPTNIPAQSLGPALKAFAQARDIQVLYLSEAVKDIRTGGAVGELTTDEALIQLLSGTGLTYRYVSDKAITILPTSEASRAGAAPAQPATAPANSAPGDAQKEGKKSFSGGFLLAQVAQGPPASSPTVEKNNAPGSEKTLAQLQEVIVTAQKRQERLIDVPQSMSVLSSDDLAKLGAIQFSDFADTVPGLSFKAGGVGMNQVTLRGITAGVDNNPTVAIYVDEVPFGPSTGSALGGRIGFDPSVFDVDRIEVLRGPQGTLYGASAVGGLIKYVTKQPDATTFSGNAQAGLSDTGDGGGLNYNAAATVNLPIVTNDAAVRLSGYYSHDSGYIDNVKTGKKDVNHSYVDGARADFLLKPTEALSFRVTGFYQDISRGGSPTVDYTQSGQPVIGPLDQSRGFNEAFDQRFRLVSGTLTYDLPWAVLTSVSSYQTVSSELIVGADYFSAILAGCCGLHYSAVADDALLTTDRFAQEVRFSSTGSRSLEWLVGGFYTHERNNDQEHFVLLDLAGLPAPNGVFTYALPASYDEYAAFADLTAHLTSTFDITGGVRYAHDRQQIQQFGAGLFGVNSPPFSSSENVLTYLANARYHFTDKTLGYLRFATGYRPGGPADFIVKTEPNHFGPDQVKSYEAGIKSETAERRVGVDLSVYYLDWINMQAPVTVGGFATTTNAIAPAHVQGAELTLSVRPVADFIMTGAFAYQHAYIAGTDPNLGAAEGERIPNVPRFTAAVNADYVLAHSAWSPTLGATLKHVSDRESSFAASVSSPQYHLPGYTDVDVRAGLVLGSVNLQLYVRNLFDERGQLSEFTAIATPTPEVVILQPRTFGISATARF